MDRRKITFKKIVKGDKTLLQGWLKKTSVKEHFSNLDERIEDIENFLKGKKSLSDYWIALYEKVPFALLIVSDASEPPEDPIIPWLEPEGMTWKIDFIITEKKCSGKEFATAMLQRFVENQNSSATAFLADPEVKDEQGISIYEEAGFVKVTTFIRGQGFFKGNPHYLMKLKHLQ